LLISEFLLVVLNGSVISLLGALALFLETAFKAVSLDFKEGLELG
jgi:hypothetical protein